MKPKIRESGHDVRLRRVGVDEYVHVATPWYRDAEVLDLSEGGSDPYDEDRLRRMFEATSKKGEVYIIEIRENDRWIAVGDAALLSDAVPIVIGDEGHRSRGIGSRALRLLIRRAKALSRPTIWVSGVLSRNERSLRMYERAGFKEYQRERDSRGEESIKMRLDLM
jgi:RimJ/RimL family protein N-acetyltransferase